MFFSTSSSSYTTIILLLSLLQYSCLSFSPPLSQQQQQHLSSLHAVTKQQTFILDGAELSHYVQSLAADHNINSDDEKNNLQLPDVAPRSLKKRKRVASVSFVTAVLDEDIVLKSDEIIKKGAKIIGIEVVQKEQQSQKEDSRGIITIDKDVQLYQDSIAVIPPSLKVSDADIISTAATSLLGVHSSSTTRKRAVIVGGGDYAIFLAKALVALNVKTHLVTARPTWSLPSPQDIAGSSSKELIEIMPPAVGAMSLGFAMAIGEFDVLIDTLGDEMGMGRARTIVNNDGYDIGQSSLQQWKELHGCTEYISTVTRSQQYVLGKGLLFARDAVIRYQEEVESKRSTAVTSSSPKGVIPSVPPPQDFGATMQSLLDKNVIYPAGSNEVGSQGDKSAFVRGWSLSDLTELKTWPRASEGAGRFGFPVIDLNAPRIRPMKETKKGIAPNVDKIVAEDANKDDAYEEESSTSELTSSESMMETTVNATSTRQIKVTKSSSKKVSSNPYVTTISSASEMNQNIVEARRNCILFLTASYCQKCKRLTPQFQRIARKSSDSDPSANSSSANDVLFAHVDISAGPKGKQLGKLLNVEKVPSVIIFQNGNQVELDGEESSIVVERGNLNRLDEVVDALDKGESHLKLKDLLSVHEAVQQ